MSERITQSGSESAPFFLVGSERSGTTFLRLMLSHHPRIECGPEFEFLVEKIGRDSSWPDLDRYRSWLETNRVFLPLGLEVDDSLDYPALVRSFVRQHCEPSGKAVCGVTCHKRFAELERIWPGARYVHLLRDGRDVARSCIGMGWVGNVWYGAERWIEAQEEWDLLQANVATERLFTVRYEDLLQDHVRVLSELCEFLGCDYDPAMLDYVNDSTYGPPDPSLVEQWRRKLSERELGLLETRIGTLLRRRGYCESGVPSVGVGPVGRLRLSFENKLGRFRFRRGRYGLGLLVRSRIANVLGLEGMQRKITLERNAIDNALIK